jgi:mRNA interferase RelE/StbE
MPRTKCEIVLAPGPIEDWKGLSARDRASVRDALEIWLRHEPRHVSRSRIKRLRGLRQPQFRLRVDTLRVFYDVNEETVEILAIIDKERADAGLSQKGKHGAPGGPGPDEG